MSEQDVGGGKGHFERLQGRLDDALARAEAAEAEARKYKHLFEKVQAKAGDTIWMESGVRPGDHQPFVHMHWGENAGQFTVDQVKEHALNLLECAFAAEGDSVFVRAMTRDGKMEEDTAMAALVMLRQERGDADSSSRGHETHVEEG